MMPYRSIKLIALACVFGIFGCAGDTKVHVSAVHVSAEIEETESVTLGTLTVFDLESPQLYPVIECLGEKIREAVPETILFDGKRFRDAMYPWFEPSTFPEDDAAVANLMQHRLVRDKVSELGVRFVIGVRGAHSAITEKHGVYTGPPFSGGVRGSTTHKSTSANLVILDLENRKALGRLWVSASGTGDVGVFLVIPYFFLAPNTEEIVCEEIAERVIALLEGRRQTEPKAAQ